MTVGDKYTLERVVDESFLASHLKSGTLDVLATPCMIAFMEEACMYLAQRSLESGMTTVGTSVDIVHLKASGLGQVIRVDATLDSIEGNMLMFGVEAHDEDGIIGKGRHGRAIIDIDRFSRKLNSKR